MTPIKVFESSNLKHGLRACVQIVFCIMWHKQGNFKFPIDDHFWCLRSTRSASGREMFCSHQWSRKEMPGQSADPFTDACWTAFVLKSCRVHMQDTQACDSPLDINKISEFYYDRVWTGIKDPTSHHHQGRCYEVKSCPYHVDDNWNHISTMTVDSRQCQGVFEEAAWGLRRG